MSHVDAGPLASYNSLLDPHLAGYFSNTRMRQHLVKSGLITRRGNIVSENTYRLNMARKEHKKHVRDLLAQAIVHKTLDLERTRQVAIKKKLEEIAKEEMVRRVKESCNRHGDEELLPYLKPSTNKGSRPSSVPSSSSRKSSEQIRPVSAPSKSQQKRSKSSEGQRGQAFLMLDEEGMPHSTRGRSTSGSTESRSRSRSARSCSKNTSKYPTEELDDRHLYSLNSQTLRDYTMARYDMDSTLGPSPYRLPQLPPDMLPAPPTSHSPRPPSRRQHRGQSAKSHSMSASTNRSNRGQLMLHRQEPAMKHQERVQTLCDVNMHYFGNSLSLDYERFDPRDEVMVEQQHCGGNTLIVYREKILPGSDFTFTSRRHRGYPFSLTFYVNGVLDCRLSTCCEYKHQSGARLGGKQGHFGMVGIDGAAPCYKCQINNTNNKKKRRRRTKHKSKPDEKDENVHVAVEEDEKNGQDVNVRGIGDDQDRHLAKDDSVQVPVEEDQQSAKDDYNYSDEDFDDDDDKKSNASSHSSSYTSSSSGSSSSSSGASSHFSEDVMWNITVYTSKKQFAGTDAGVYIVLHGDTSSKKNVKSNKIILDNSENNFEQGKKDEFKRDAPNFEKLTKIRIGHDNSGAASAWHLDHVVLENTVTGKSFIFHCNNWVSGCEDDNVVERELYPAGSEEAKQSSRIPKVEWNVCVYTSDVRNAGTDSDVYILLTGELKNGEVKESDKMILDNSRNNFERDQCDKFTIKTYDYENLIKLRIGHNNKGIASAWHLNKIVLENANSGKSYAFYCNKWLADNKGDQAIERELFPAGSEQARKSDRAKKAKWNVNVYTSDVRNAGTDSDVYIVLIGETEDGEVKESDKMILDNNKNNFERGQCDQFSIETYDYVKLTKLRIGHNNNGFGAAWHLNKVIVENTSSGTKYTFHCNKWLADDEDDCVVERELEPNTESNEEPMRERQQQGSIEQNKEDAKGSISSSTSTLKSTNEDDASVKIKAERATKAKQMLTSKDTGGEPIKNSIISNESMSRSDKDSTKGNSSPRGSDINLVSSSDNGSSGCSDEGSLSDKDSTRNNDKGSPRGSDKPSPQPIDKDSTPMSDKCSHRTSNDGSGSSSDENSSRSIDRGSHTDEGLTRKSERDFPRGSDKGSLQGSNKGSPTGSDKGSPRGTDIGSPQCSNKGSPRDIDRDSQQRGEMSHENNDATSSREMDDKPSEDPDIAQENNKEKQSPDGDHSNEDTSEQNIVDASNEKQKPREDTDRESLSSSSSSSYTSDSSDSSSEDNKQMQAPDQPEDKTGEQNGKDVTDHTNSIIAAGEEFEGSIRPLIEGKKNIELINIMLNQHQVQELCDVIRETGEVETLVLRHSNLSDNDLEKLAAALISTSSDDLEMLNLNFNNITSAGVPHLVNIVKNKRNLQVLLLHNTAIGDEGLNMLVDALLQANDSRNKDADTIKEMAKGIVTNVIKNAIESSSAQGTEETNSQEGSDMTSGGGSENEKLVSALEDLNKLGALKLEQLDIGDCQITDNGVESLAKLIAANTQLDHLCLTGNKAITPSAWKKLGEALRSNTNLYDCGLDYTDLRDQGVISLLDGAEGNKGLHSLDLEGNKIGDEGGRKILQFLHNHPNVKDLNLMPGNHINQFLLGEIKQEIAQKN